MEKPNFYYFLKVTIVSLICAMAVVALIAWYALREPTIGDDFTLQYREQTWNFFAHVKPVNLLYIGYAKCPDVCPLSLSHASQAFRQLTPDELKSAQLIFISVDVAHDTAKDVADYAAQFFPSFIGLTGSESEIQRTVNLFGASFMVEKDPKSYLGYSIAHTDRLFFLDQKGHVIDTIASPRSAEEILAKIRKHL